MISSVSLLFLYTMARTTSALKLLSPIQIVRPINDVYTNCEQDVKEFCSHISMYDSYGYDQNIPNNASEDTREGEDARRLSEVESKETTAYSISAKIRIAPKTSQESTLHSKDSTRFLNYGPNIDMCLWDAFDAQHVSSQCASALTYINSFDEFLPYHYENDSGYHYMYMSISFSAVTLCMFIMIYLLIKAFLIECDDNDGVEDQSNSEHENYQCLDDSKCIAYVAVPVQTV